MISINNLTFQFEDRLILKDISLTFEDKQVYYLTGPMGSGKSLILNAIAKGEKTVSDSPTYKYSFIGDQRLLFEEISVKDNLYFYQKLFNTSKNEQDILINYFGFAVNIDKNVDELSEGNKQVLYLICLFMNSQVDIYLLDEPFVNLDTEATKRLGEYLKKLSKDAIVVYTSHTYDNPDIYDYQIKIADQGVDVQ